MLRNREVREAQHLVPTQPEQLANGMKLQDMHCSVVANNDGTVETGTSNHRTGSKPFRSSVEKLNEFSNKFNGLEPRSQKSSKKP